jgi:hypothetical protein
MLGDEQPSGGIGDGEDGIGEPGKRRGWPKGKPRKLKEEPVAENQGISMEEVFKLIAKMDENQQKNMMAFAAELKKPTAIEQAKLDADQAKLKQKAESAAKLAMAEEKAKDNRRRGCPHGTTHPGTKTFTHQWRAQVHTPDGEKPYFIPTCTHCWTQLPKIYATTEQLQNGVNLDQYASIDLEKLETWAKQSQAQMVA